MPKSRTKRKTSSSGARRIAWGGPARASDRRWSYAIGIAAAAAIAYGAYAWWGFARTEKGFMALAESGQSALQAVETIASEGRRHLDPGDIYQYRSRFPTSGPHDPIWTRPGVYEETQQPTRLVHALEHGNIVIYYDEPGAQFLELLNQWADLYDEQWSGLVVTPSPGLGATVVLTAWTKRLELDLFDPAAAAAFIDAFRGRGPEHPVR